MRVVRLGAAPAWRSFSSRPSDAAHGGHDDAALDELVARPWPPDRAGRPGCRAGRARAPLSRLLLARSASAASSSSRGARLELLEPHVADAGRERRGCPRDLMRISSRMSSKGREPCQPSLPSRCTQTVTLEPGLPRRRFDRVVERHVERRLVVDLHDAVEPLEAGASRRRVRHRAHDRELLIADRDHDAETAEVARGGEVHLLGRPPGSGTRCAGRACAACRCTPRTRPRGDRPRCPSGCAWRKANTSRSRAATSQGPCTLSTRNSFSSVSTRTLTVGRLLVVQHDDLRDLLLNLVERARGTSAAASRAPGRRTCRGWS